MKKTVQTLRSAKGQTPLVALTAYDFITARLADQAGVDLLLVGDSLGTTVLGYPNTVKVTLDMMIHHTAAVARAQPKALVVTDLPFGWATRPWGELLAGATRCLQEGGSEAVKIEGGKEIAGSVEKLVQSGIPVLGHIGLLPQQVHRYGGYRKFGKTGSEKESLLRDALALEEAGAFALVLEMVDAKTTALITQETKIPVIGIGSGKDCDGQILVSSDILGLTPGPIPKFAKRYDDLAARYQQAFSAYANDVRSGKE
ncbi:MAG: 3-methyl-2-oxobutanoate hydroxymethyltransferase [Opitutales bacterium]|nr:3-methyl-2-oxobutanoate hydroxymethyltransferase [Opitutales bacterium]